MHRRTIGDVEIGVPQRCHIVLARQSTCEMAAHQPGRAGN
jgi:hypothetical protein